MPATQTDAQIKNDARPNLMSLEDRKRIREEKGPELQHAAVKVSGALQAFGAMLRQYRDTYFSAGEVKPGKAFDKYLLVWTGLKRSTADGYMRIAEVLAEVEDADDRKLVASFPTDAIKSFGTLKVKGEPDEEKRDEYLTKVRERIAKGAPVLTKDHEKIRDDLKPRQKRATPDAAEKTATLVTEIRESVETLLAGNPTTIVAMIAAAQWQKDRPKDDVPAALLFILENPTATAVESEVA